MGLLEFIDSSNQCTNISHLTELFEKTLFRFGFEKYVYGRGEIGPDHGDIKFIAAQKNYPMDFVKYYLQKNYQHHDAVRAYYKSQLLPVTWKSIYEKPWVSEKSKMIINEAQDAGLNSGIIIPIRSVNNDFFRFVVGSQMTDRILNKNQMSELHAIANQFHVSYITLLNPKPDTGIKLSSRQQEILCWIASGKSTPVISELMSISQNTVNDHLRVIFRKLECNDRVVAVLKAIKFGLINY